MKIEHTGGHLDQMLRQTRAHHVQLSAMADAKANALITIAAVVTTFSASAVARPGFQAAVIVLIIFNLLTIILATVTVMPGGVRPRKQAAAKPGPNLLFFGGFQGMSYQEYEAAMEEVMNDPSKAYEMQVREIYMLGRYLASHKYRSLRYAYAAFLAGLFLSGAVLLAQNL